MTDKPELSVVGRIEAMPELPEPDAFKATKLLPYEERWFFSPGMAEKLGYTVDRTYYSKETVLTYASQTLASRDGEIARLRGALEPFANIAYYEELVSAMSATLDRYEEQSALIAAFINARAVLVVAPQPTKEQSNG